MWQHSKLGTSVPTPAPPAPLIRPLGSRGTYYEESRLPLQSLLDRVERLESCFESELRAALGVCRGVVEAGVQEHQREAAGIGQALERIGQLEVSTRELTQRLQRCAKTEDLQRCLREDDWAALNQRLEERVGTHIERSMQDLAELEKNVKAWREKMHKRCTTLEKRASEQTQDVRVAELATSMESLQTFTLDVSRSVEILVAKCQQLENQHTDADAKQHQTAVAVETFQQQIRSRLGGLESCAQDDLAQQLTKVTQELREDMDIVKRFATAQQARESELEGRLSLAAKKAAAQACEPLAARVSDLRAGASASSDELKKSIERQIEALVVRFEDISKYSSPTATLEQRLGDLEARKDGLFEACKSHWERSASELRIEIGAASESKWQTLQLSVDELRRSAANTKKETDRDVKDLRSATSTLTKQFECHMEEARSAADRSRATAHAMEQASLASQRGSIRLDGLESRLDAAREVAQQQLERATRESRTEVQGNLEAVEGRLVLLMQELQGEVGGFKKQLERTSLDFQQASGTMSKQVQAALDEARGASDRAGSSAQAGLDAAAAAERAERRLHNFEGRVDTALGNCQQQLNRGLGELRAEAVASVESTKRQIDHIAEELSANSASLLKQLERSTAELRSEADSAADASKKHVEHVLEELRAADAGLAKQAEQTQNDLASTEERARTALRLAEEASMASQNTEGRVGSLEKRIEASTETRCQRTERLAREAGQEAKSHADTLSKQLGNAAEPLKDTVNALAKQVRTTAEDARVADDRGIAAVQAAQEAVSIAQRAEKSAKSTFEVNRAEVSRLELDRTMSDLRLEAKSGVNALGKEMESTILELRGTVSALALQVECGVSGCTSTLADTVETAAQRHVDYLELLKALDGHRGQMETQQAELERRLNSLLNAQKTTLVADLEAVSLRVAEHSSRIAELSIGFTNANSGVKDVEAHVSALETHLKARIIEWELFSESMRDSVGSLQAGIAENKWGVVTIAGAISTIAKPEA